MDEDDFEEPWAYEYDGEFMYPEEWSFIGDLSWNWLDVGEAIAEEPNDKLVVKCRADIEFNIDLDQYIDWREFLEQLPGLVSEYIPPEHHPAAGSGNSYEIEDGVTLEVVTERLKAALEAIEEALPSLRDI